MVPSTVYWLDSEWKLMHLKLAKGILWAVSSVATMALKSEPLWARTTVAMTVCK